MTLRSWMNTTVLALLSVAILLGCDRTPESQWTLQQAGDKLYEIRGVALGDIYGVAFGPFPQADWLVILPADTDTETLAELGAFAKTQSGAFDELVGQEMPIMALVRKGVVVERFNLDHPYMTKQPLVKRADMVAGIQAARHAGGGRNFEIRRIQ